MRSGPDSLSVWLNRAGVGRRKGDRKPDYEIRSLRELTRLLFGKEMDSGIRPIFKGPAADHGCRSMLIRVYVTPNAREVRVVRVSEDRLEVSVDERL